MLLSPRGRRGQCYSSCFCSAYLDLFLLHGSWRLESQSGLEAMGLGCGHSASHCCDWELLCYQSQDRPHVLLEAIWSRSLIITDVHEEMAASFSISTHREYIWLYVDTSVFPLPPPSLHALLEQKMRKRRLRKSSPTLNPVRGPLSSHSSLSSGV